VRTVVAMIDAYNKGDFRTAADQFTRDPRFTRFVGAADCDYRDGRYIRFAGRASVSSWLRERTADHDKLIVSRMTLIGDRGAAIAYVRRTSDTLRSLGFTKGIGPVSLATKVGFTTAGPSRITQFANAGGEACHPH
jgi:hypothetical protein